MRWLPPLWLALTACAPTDPDDDGADDSPAVTDHDELTEGVLDALRDEGPLIVDVPLAPVPDAVAAGTGEDALAMREVLARLNRFREDYRRVDPEAARVEGEALVRSATSGCVRVSADCPVFAPVPGAPVTCVFVHQCEQLTETWTWIHTGESVTTTVDWSGTDADGDVWDPTFLVQRDLQELDGRAAVFTVMQRNRSAGRDGPLFEYTFAAEAPVTIYDEFGVPTTVQKVERTASVWSWDPLFGGGGFHPAVGSSLEALGEDLVLGAWFWGLVTQSFYLDTEWAITEDGCQRTRYDERGNVIETEACTL